VTGAAPRADTGRRGEAAARRFLESRGYRILTTNFRTPVGEVDLIAQRGDIICFVEVKCRSVEDEYAPQLTVTPTKQRRVARAARRFLAGRRDLPPSRFDVIEVILRGRGVGDIRHHPAAFNDPL